MGKSAIRWIICSTTIILSLAVIAVTVPSRPKPLLSNTESVPYAHSAMAHSSRDGNYSLKPTAANGVGIIDGSKTPDLIPDSESYHILLLISSTDEKSKPVAAARANAVLKMLHLSNDDANVIADIAKRYRTDFSTSRSIRVASEDLYHQAKLARTNNAVSEILSRMTPAGIAKVQEKIQETKRHIKLFPIPSMDTTKLSIWNRIFSLGSVHAQTMSPYGTAYSDVSIDDNSIVYGTGITDGDSNCQCHSSYAETRIFAPGGTLLAGPIADEEVEYAEADLSYQWDPFDIADFTGNQADASIIISSYNRAYCPWIANNFIDEGTTSLLPVRVTYLNYAFVGLQTGVCRYSVSCDNGLSNACTKAYPAILVTPDDEFGGCAAYFLSERVILTLLGSDHCSPVGGGTMTVDPSNCS